MSASVHRPQLVVYSHDSAVRKSLIAALGSAVASDMPPHDIHEFATGSALRVFVDRKGPEGRSRADLFILDGEAVPEGGLGIARQLKDEVFNCPPVMVVIARADDAWLAAWSRADATITHPVDPFTVAHKVADLLRAGLLADTTN